MANEWTAINDDHEEESSDQVIPEETTGDTTAVPHELEPSNESIGIEPETTSQESDTTIIVDEEIAATPQANGVSKEDLVGFFTRPLLSKKKTDELKELVNGADAIHHRIDEAETSIKVLADSSAKLHKQLGKAIAQVFKEIEQSQLSHERTIEQIITELRSDIAGQASSAKLFQSTALAKVDDAAGTISGVNGSLTGIRDYLAENNKLTQRLQEGYDFQILKNFIRQISRTIGFLEKQAENSSDEGVKRELGEAVYDLVQLLERNGIEQICPDVGTAFDGLRKYAEALPDKVPAESDAVKGQIASVERVGYKYEFNDGQERIIQPAKVKLYE